ncbi:MAG: dihydrofolate reductase [Coriobacteriaceae bacterium]|nr:dihydrofolate reductase [Coriobacteriaceae bacterium]
MTCTLKAIVAVCDDWGIGRDGDMVVANRADMRHFVNKTKGHPVIMGRKTLESFPGGKPLKDRRNIVLTRDDSFTREGVEVAHSIDEALAMVGDEGTAWVIGGGAVYEQFLPYCVEVEVTHNHVTHPVDTFFPNLAEDPDWDVVERRGECVIGDGQGDEGVRYEFTTYRRKGHEPEKASSDDKFFKSFDVLTDAAIVISTLLDG